jgi:hypothetical protein
MSSEALNTVVNCQPSTSIITLNDTAAVTPSTSTSLNLYKKTSSTSLFYKTLDGGEVELKASSGGGLTPPEFSTDNAVVRWDGIDAKTVQNSTITLSDAGVFSALDSAAAVNATTQYNLGGVKLITSNVDNLTIGLSSGDPTGAQNVCIGPSSGVNLTTGTNNVTLGHTAGGGIGSGDSNILIGKGASINAGANPSNCIVIGTDIEATAVNQIRIGASDHTTCFIRGIRGVTTAVGDAVNVLVDSNGQLGTVSSSLRYKENVSDMKEYSDNLHLLRPVTFNWKPEHNESKKLQVGLIAEEVAQTFPSLAIYKDGIPETVAYQNLVPMLLNELQKCKKEVQLLRGEVQPLREEVQTLKVTV